MCDRTVSVARCSDSAIRSVEVPLAERSRLAAWVPMGRKRFAGEACRDRLRRCGSRNGGFNPGPGDSILARPSG
jgi:hypothetical protein